MHIETIEPRRLLAAVGPDGYGYVADPHPFENIDLQITDPGVGTFGIDLGRNTFNYYGRTVSGDRAVAATESGAIQVGDFGSLGNNTRLNTGPFQPIIAALWDTWSHPAGSRFLWKLDDTGGDDAPERLIVQWSVFDDHNLPAVKFHAILQLNTGDRPGDIVLNYESLDSGDAATANGASATVGVKDLGYDSNRLLVSFNNPQNALVGDGKAIRIHNDSTGQPFAHAGRAALADEGPRIDAQLDGTKSSDPNQPSDSLAYAWDFDLDGVYGEAASDFGDERGAAPTFIRDDGTVVDGPLQIPLVLRVTDASGFSSYGKGWVGVRNVVGTASVSGPTSVAPGTPVTLTVGASDPGNDVANVDVDWDDGAIELVPLAAPQATHTYYLPGTRSVRVSVRNDFGEPLTNPTIHTITVSALPDLALDDAGILLISGTSGDDTITLAADAGNARLTRNGVITTYPLADVKGIAIDAAAGNNIVTVAIDIPVSVLSGAGNDTVTAGVGKHELLLGGGNNTVITGAYTSGATAGPRVITGSGNDTISVPGGSDLIDAGDGDNVVNTQAARRVVTGSGNDIISVPLVGGTLVCFSGDGDDSITSGDGSDTIDCGNGNDTVSSGALSDYVTAGGDVTTGVGAIIDGGEAPDRIQARFARRIIGGDEDSQFSGDTIVAGHCPDVDGGAGHDIIRIGSDATHPAIVRGGDGDDDIFTGAGHDSIYGGAGRDTVHAGSGSDLVSGGGGHDLLFGQGGRDRLYGGDGNDRLFGQRGDDRLFGFAGSDTVNGGAGTDSADEDALDILRGVEATIA